jgi:hypothetical protein
MKKFFVLILLTITLLTGCKKQDKALIFFSSNSISAETFSIDKAEQFFTAGKKINFVLLNPKPFTSPILRLQVLKVNDKLAVYGYSIEHARDVEIDMSKHYAINSFVLYREGYYILRIFSKDALNEPIAEADFRVFQP